MIRATLSALVLLLACDSSSAKPSAKTPPKPEAKPEAKPTKPAKVGSVMIERFHSDALGVDKEVYVYLPAGYDPSGAKHYPVFYYLHGMGGDEGSWVKNGKLAEAADVLGLAAIVVMPDGDFNFYIDSALHEDYDGCIKDGVGMIEPDHPRDRTCVRSSSYESYITKDLISFVDTKYRTIATRDGRGIAGLSMGGYGALMLAMRHPNLFSSAASHSGVDAILYKGPYPYQKGKVLLYTDVADLTQWQGKLGKFGDWIRGVFGSDIANWRDHDPAILLDKLAPGTLSLYLDCGTEDKFLLHNGMQYLHDRLLANKLDHAYYIGPGGHDMTFWKARVPHSLAFLRDHLAKPVVSR